MFKTYAIGYVPIDIAEIRTEEGKLHLQLFINGLQLRPAAKDTERLHVLRVCLAEGDKRAKTIQHGPVKPHPGTERLRRQFRNPGSGPHKDEDLLRNLPKVAGPSRGGGYP